MDDDTSPEIAKLRKAIEEQTQVQRDMIDVMAALIDMLGKAATETRELTQQLQLRK